MKQDLKDIFLMGLGAIGMTSDKAKELQGELLKRGTEMFEASKIANEELKHNMEEKIKENVTIIVEEKKDLSDEEMFEKIKGLSSEEKSKLLELLKEENKNE